MIEKDLRNALTSARLLQASVYQVPNTFTFHKDHLYYLSLHQAENALWCINLKTNAKPKILLTQLKENTKLSKEEELLRERMRSVVSGITNYTIHEKTNKILLPGGSSIFVYDIENQTLKDVTFKDIGSRMDCKFSFDGKFISHVNSGNIYVINMQNGMEKKLTNTHDPNITSGVAEFIMQEEFDRFTGYWWCEKKSLKGMYRIAYLEVDLRKVPIVKIPQSGEQSDVDEFKYPRAGQTNAKSTLCVVEFDENLENVKIHRYEGAIEKKFPWCEYVVRVGWISDKIWLQLLDRKQQHTAYVLFDIETQEFKVLYEETTNVWINVGNIFKVLSDGSVILLSEKTGFNHLYHIDTNGKMKQLTNGEWIVFSDKIWVDEKKKLVYFTATKDTPLEKHLYVSSLNQEANENPIRLTELGYYYNSFAFNQDKSAFCCSFSSITSTPQTVIYALEDTKPKKIQNVEFKFDKVKTSFPLVVPKLFNFKNRHGDTIYGVYYKPNDYNPDKKYPALLYIYGGPGPQLVTNKYSIFADGRLQYLASLGYIIINIDGRGSNNRGLKFESILKHRMGQVELEDQIDGIKYLASNKEHGVNIDPNRIGIYGWSYGGYMSLMALGQHPNFFKIAISGAPVTKWELYDTGYTERYMDTPQNNPKGYLLGSVTYYAKDFPDEPNRLLIIHGTSDENVHWKHTEVLISELVKYQKPYQLQVYPGERHGIRNGNSVLHYMTSFVRFITQNL